MGAVTINTYNVQLMALADYSSRQQVKKLYKMYDNLYELAECGDSVAASIYIDLKTALDVVTEKQRECIVKHLIDSNTIRNVASDLNKSESTISQSVEGGIKRIMKELTKGSLYFDK